jgi:hypothetical protein
MTGSDEDHDRSRRPSVEDWGWSSISRGQVMLCAVCTVHEETRSARFLLWLQNHGLWFIIGLASKPLGRFLPVWPQNQW